MKDPLSSGDAPSQSQSTGTDCKPLGIIDDIL